jgi:hypothetical protein
MANSMHRIYEEDSVTQPPALASRNHRDIAAATAKA